MNTHTHAIKMEASIKEQIKAIEEEIFNTQKNKATEHHIGKLKAKIAKLKEEVERRKSSQKKGKGFSIKKSGDATVGIIGFPNVGKSTLLNKLTGAESKVGNYNFTTLDVIPGIIKYKGADIQLLDLPGFIEGAAEGKGRGREILSAIRSVDLLLIMIDVLQIKHLDIIDNELYSVGLRLNQKKPDIVITKKTNGGIIVNSTRTLSSLNENLIKSISSEFLINADITIREDINEDQLIDYFSENRIYVPAIVALNKKDLISPEDLKKMYEKIKEKWGKVESISAETNEGLNDLVESIFTYLRFIRVFMKPVGKKIDYNEPLILREGNTVEDACKKIHRDFKRKFRYATVSGPSAKHDNQKVGLKHKLKDQDILTLIIWKK
jgi:small GTP-binding protein